MSRNVRPFSALLETLRIALAAAAGAALAGVFATTSWVGSGDAYWYDNMLADFVSQWRAGVFPVFVGQSEFAFNGAVSPVRFAPYFQHLAGLLDLLTGRTLGFYALQNLTLVLSFAGGGVSAYLCCAAILRHRRWTALALAVLYVASPGALALLYTGNLFMSVMTLPYLPLAAYGLWRWWTRTGEAAWLALPLAAVWWCHPPIALWLTAIIGIFAALRVALSWRDRRLWLAAGAAAGLFILAAGAVFVSVLTLPGPSTPQIDRLSFLGSIEHSVPASFLPVSRTADKISDYQLGWSLWIVAGAAGFQCSFRPRRGSSALLGAVLLLVLFLLPVPGVNRWLWAHCVPQAACDITFGWVVQRLYVILAALVVVAAAAAAAAWPPRSRIAQIAGGLFFVAALSWSGLEAAKFERRGAAMVLPDAEAAKTHGASNAYLTRYAFNIFRPVPSYFSHGYVDPWLENRVLAADGRTVLASNSASVHPSGSNPSFLLTAAYDPAGGQAALTPQFAISPGLRYAARLELHLPAAPGILLAEGERTRREYFLPDSSFGMFHEQPTHAFGFLPGSGDFFSIWNPGGDTIHLTYQFTDSAPAAIPADFGRLYLRPYRVEDLPIRIVSWIPYRARTHLSAAGGWLETPRVYVPGYAATVNGRPARLLRSPDGLVAVALEPGENDVMLSYPGPWVLRVSYYVSLFTWLAAFATAAAGFVARLRTIPGR